MQTYISPEMLFTPSREPTALRSLDVTSQTIPYVLPLLQLLLVVPSQSYKKATLKFQTETTCLICPNMVIGYTLGTTTNNKTCL